MDCRMDGWIVGNGRKMKMERTWLSILKVSRRDSNVSRKSIMEGSVSKSVKWLLTHSSTTRVTLSRTVGSLNLN